MIPLSSHKKKVYGAALAVFVIAMITCAIYAYETDAINSFTSWAEKVRRGLEAGGGVVVGGLHGGGVSRARLSRAGGGICA